MCSFKSIYFVIFILNLYKTNAQISDKRLCVDPDCKEPVSHAKTLLRYSSPDPRILSFTPNADVIIYSKEAGSETNLWGAEINGKRGYIPKHLVRENRLLKKPNLLVDTELNQKPQVPIDANEDNVKPHKVQEPFEVVDGTTIYLNPQANIIPTNTENEVLSTVVPSSSSEDTEEVKDVKSESSEDGKEKEVEVMDTKNLEDSVVNNVIQTFSNWMNDDSNSEELEESEDDNEEEDEDDDYDEEDDEVENEKLETNQRGLLEEQIQQNDLNGLHNLPADIKINSYNLEVDQQVAEGNNEVKTNSFVNSNPSKEEGTNSVPPVNIHLNNNTVSENTEKVRQTDPQSETAKVEKEEEVIKNSQTENDILSVQAVTDVPISNDVPPPQINMEEVTPNPIELKVEQTLDATESPQQILLNNVSESQKTVSNSEESVIQPDNSVVTNLDLSGIAVPDVDNFVQISNNNGDITSNTEETKSSESSSQIPNPVVETIKSPEIDIVPNLIDNNARVATSLPPLGGLFSDRIQNVETIITDKIENDLDKSTNIPDNNSDKTDDISMNNVYAASNENTDTLANNFSSNSNEESIKNTSKEDVVNFAQKENLALPDKNNESEEIINETSNEDVLEGNSEKDVLAEHILNDSSKETVQSPETLLDTAENSILEEPTLNDLKQEDAEIPEDANKGSGDSGGLFSGFLSIFGYNDISYNSESALEPEIENHLQKEQTYEKIEDISHSDATLENCGNIQNHGNNDNLANEKSIMQNLDIHFNTDIFLYLVTTAVSVILFLFGYLAFDRNKKEAPLVARINKLEKELLITLKENELLQERRDSAYNIQQVENIPNEYVEQLTQRIAEFETMKLELEGQIARLKKDLETKQALEEQVETLEKELETSTEVGMELNRIISEMLDPTNGSEKLKENVDQLQRQLLEQKDTINKVNETLSIKENENKKIYVELEKYKKTGADLQNKLDDMVDKVFKIEKEKDQQLSILQSEIAMYQQKYTEASTKEDILNSENQVLRVQLSDVQRQVELKTKEYQTLKESINSIKSMTNDSNALKSLLDASSLKAELLQLKSDNEKYLEVLQQEKVAKVAYEKKYGSIVDELNVLKQKYEQADKEKVEVISKLDVLNNYFRKREAELQEEIIKYKSIWDAKEGVATSASERLKYMQEEIENYKAQNEALKQEIISQEIDLKSQISMLENKVHENWVTARQTDRKLEDARQEASQLRSRLTLRERTINERLQSPIDQNGDLTLSPHPMDSPASPPLLYGARDHITKSPPLPGLPPFLPPPPGAPFMPPPIHGMPPFMPPPPMFPGDHRPPPLGRMSSPPLNSRYSPDASAFSPYDRDSPSPPYDSEYGASPPPLRGYSPYNSRDNRRDYKRPPPPHVRTNGRNAKGSIMSSGSGNSNDSLDKINRNPSKMV